MKNIRTIMAVLAGALCLQSCLFEEEDIFEQSPSARLQQRLSDCREALTSQEYGWELDMFPDENQSYGGFAYTLKFHGDSVDVQTELATNMKVVVSSLYKTSENDGPTLSFDTYNEYFHYYSTPSQYHYTASGGEFEFIIYDVQPDLITLRGAKTGNTMYLRALKESPNNYLAKVKKMDKYFQKLLPTIGDEKKQVMIRTHERYAEVTDMETGEVSEVAISVSSEGVRFYGGIEFANETVCEVKPITENSEFVGVTTDNGGSLEWIKPAGWEDYDDMDFENHEWVLKAQLATPQKKTKDVEIPVTFSRYSSNGEKGYNVSGIWASHVWKLNYIRREGKLNFSAYKIANTGSTLYPYRYVCPARQASDEMLYTVSSFYLADYYEDQGMMFVSDGNGSYNYVNNLVYDAWDYDCICVKDFSEDLSEFKYIVGDEWLVNGADKTLADSYGCFVLAISKLERVK